MALRFNDGYAKEFLNESDYAGIATQTKEAFDRLISRTGLGNDFLGWIDLPRDYDKEEFARIKAAAKRIKEDSDILIVIGISGSYLGARAAIEFLKSPLSFVLCLFVLFFVKILLPSAKRYGIMKKIPFIKEKNK